MERPNFENAYKIFEQYPQKLAEVKKWEGTWRRAALANNLFEHGEIKILLEMLTKFMAENEKFLLGQQRSTYTNDNLYFEDRVKREAENLCWTWFIHIFTRAESNAENIKGKVEDTNSKNNN